MEVHSSSEQILITDSGGRERERERGKPVATYLMEEMLPFSMTNSPSFRQTNSGNTGLRQHTLEVANRGVKM